jgi:hypothetical protein
MGGSRTRKRAKAKRLRAKVRSKRRKLKQNRPRKIAVVAMLSVLVPVVVSLPSAISVLTAKVPVMPLGSIDPAAPLRARFQVANDGAFSIYDVTPEFLFNARWGGLVFKNDKVAATRPPWIREIEPGSKPVTLMAGYNTSGPGPFEKGDFVDVTVTITFTAKFTWWRKRITRRFFAERNRAGEMEWIQIPAK